MTSFQSGDRLRAWLGEWPAHWEWVAGLAPFALLVAVIAISAIVG